MVWLCDGGRVDLMMQAALTCPASQCTEVWAQWCLARQCSSQQGGSAQTVPGLGGSSTGLHACAAWGLCCFPCQMLNHVLWLPNAPCQPAEMEHSRASP